MSEVILKKIYKYKINLILLTALAIFIFLLWSINNNLIMFEKVF